MNNADYKRFCAMLQGTQQERNYIYHAGYLWLQLTERQVDRLSPILSHIPDVKTTLVIGMNTVKYTLPNGLQIKCKLQE